MMIGASTPPVAWRVRRLSPSWRSTSSPSSCPPTLTTDVRVTTRFRLLGGLACCLSLAPLSCPQHAALRVPQYASLHVSASAYLSSPQHDRPADSSSTCASSKTLGTNDAMGGGYGVLIP